MTLESFQVIGPEEIAAANRRWDQAHGDPYQPTIRPSWNEGQLLRRGRLTDKKIAKYERQGYFSAELKKE